MIRSILLSTLLLFTYARVQAFCGFYVAKADASLYNKTSQVIMVREGNRTVITMVSDFKGDVNDFAMVVPVPEVLNRSDIRVVSREIFEKMDNYTSPRLVEYFDPQICRNHPDYSSMLDQISKAPAAMEDVGTKMMSAKSFDRSLGVKVKARYKVEEYEVVLLSAKNSEGLETWLTAKGYKIPDNAREALQPYIRNHMKFFLVKVDAQKHKSNGYTSLRPLQISFKSNRFMLPIRLGMANAESEQDMIIYALTKGGRIESTNYRTIKMPTDRQIPTFIKNDNRFGEFYNSCFGNTHQREGQNGVFLEYSWDISGHQQTKCDPCTFIPRKSGGVSQSLVTYQELKEAGVWWLKPNGNMYAGDLHVTRLHVRYSRESFPQDLSFNVTPNRERFQARYVVRHPAPGNYACENARPYVVQLKERQRKELSELASLTGWSTSSHSDYVFKGTVDDLIATQQKAQQSYTDRLEKINEERRRRSREVQEQQNNSSSSSGNALPQDPKTGPSGLPGHSSGSIKPILNKPMSQAPEPDDSPAVAQTQALRDTNVLSDNPDTLVDNHQLCNLPLDDAGSPKALPWAGLSLGLVLLAGTGFAFRQFRKRKS